MKTRIFSSLVKNYLFTFSFLLISTICLGSDPPINKNISIIIDSMKITLESKYKYSLSLDESLKYGCIDFFNEMKGNKVEENEFSAHIHRGAIIPLEYYQDIPFSFFNDLIKGIIESNPSLFNAYIPERIWIEEISDGENCYLIVALD